MIKRVRELRLGDKVKYDGIIGVVRNFPTRYSVVLVNPNPKPGEWSGAKLSIREIEKRRT